MIKRRTQLADIAVDGTSRQMSRTAAIELAGEPKVRTRKNMNDSTPTRIANVEEAKDVDRGSQLETRSRPKRRRQRSTLRKKGLEIGTKTILNDGVLGFANELRKLRATLQEIRVLENKQRNKIKREERVKETTPEKET